VFWYLRRIDMDAAAFAQTREIDYQPIVPRRRQRRRLWSHVLLFAGSVLLVNGLFGERGLVETLRARRAYRVAAADLTRLREHNEALRDRAVRLRSDPATIESVARQELGLTRPDEIVVTVRDVK
jgi:cell division protein FtsB